MARMDWDMAIENLRNILERDPENTIACPFSGLSAF